MKTKLLFFAVVLLSFFSFSTRVNAQANPANPYDEMGARHNAAMATFLNEYSEKRLVEEGMDEDGVYDYMCIRVAAQNCDFQKQIRKTQVFTATADMSLTQTAAYLQAKGLVTAAFTDYVNRIDRCVSLSVSGSYSAAHAALVAIESELSTNKQVKEIEKVELLSACAIARYSAKFWTDISTGVTSYASTSAGTVRAAGDGIIKEDVAGAIKGAVGSAVGAALTGPVAPGVVGVGAAAGAAGSSAVAAAKKIWRWLRS